MSSERPEEYNILCPGFCFGEPNQETVLGEDEVSVSDVNGEEIFSGSAEVGLALLPQPAIHIEMHSEKPVRMSPGDSLLLKLAKAKTPFEAFVVSDGISSAGASFVCCSHFEPVVGIGGDTDELAVVLFHLFNFRRIIGTRGIGEKRANEWRRIECVDLSSKGWTVELQSVFETRESTEKLTSEGGYRLTHVGSISKPDRSLFTGGEAKAVLRLLKDFLSFARGLRCYPICAIGFDAAGNRIWEAWSSPKDSWSRPLSWFDEQHSEQLVALFPGFMNKCSDPDWRSALHEVIYWYLIANNTSTGIDAGIILTQTAIERLSFEYLVGQQKLLDIRSFKDRRASDTIRLLLTELDIPIELPTNLTRLNALANELKWEDSAHALTDVRNSLVHPERNKASFSGCYYDTWRLGLWYLELAILRICGYSEVYANRLTQKRVSEVEQLPWQNRD